MPFTESAPYVVPDEPLTPSEVVAELGTVQHCLFRALEQLEVAVHVAARLDRSEARSAYGALATSPWMLVNALRQLAAQVEVAGLDVRGFRADLAQLVRR